LTIVQGQRERSEKATDCLAVGYSVALALGPGMKNDGPSAVDSIEESNLLRSRRSAQTSTPAGVGFSIRNLIMGAEQAQAARDAAIEMTSELFAEVQKLGGSLVGTELTPNADEALAIYTDAGQKALTAVRNLLHKIG